MNRWKRKALAALAGLALASGGTAALAGGLYGDKVYADSFGNLVIHSPGGYKRIIVGKGYAAEGYNATGSYYEPASGDAGHAVEEEVASVEVRRCHRPPYRWVGRSYMYGLPDHVVPQAPLVCH